VFILKIYYENENLDIIESKPFRIKINATEKTKINLNLQD